ncbi:hypothetical protein EW145_g7984 [Phellinidium pouzarii]|uniref:Phosphoglycerate mutase-like protein n=1 Tax=Phellinidium pouzarii TaxID=167371 RepID=A0A4S4KBB1_9AGAM|nr:hypothetical protein EW145_g7984 [Phellinidium pouzarii]
MSGSELLGVVIIARHGDRQGFYQNPFDYDAVATSITALGNVEEFALGQQLRSMYLESNSTSLISGISTGLFDQTQVIITADGGGESGVIFDSAVSVVQALWPATPNDNSTLANGTTVISPLGGYQYVPVVSIEPNVDVSLEGWTDCNTFNEATVAFYNSSLFKQVAAENAEFLQSLPPYLDGRSVSLENMIFDYMNVQDIHNATFANRLPNGYLNRARALANFHEYGVFSSPQVDGIGNIAGRAMLPSILSGMQDIANASNPVKLVYEAISYKPFISLFNMIGIATTYPQLAGVVEYAAVTVLELRNSSTPGDPMVRLIFKNGSDDTFNTYNMFGEDGDVPLSLFTSKLAFSAVNTTAEWCVACANNADRGCGTCNSPVLAAAAAVEQAGVGRHRLSPPAAGVIGAAVTAVVLLLALGAFTACGFVSFGKSAKRGRSPVSLSLSRLFEKRVSDDVYTLKPSSIEKLSHET